MGETGMEERVFLQLGLRFPQLLLPIARQEKDTSEYREAVLRGKPVLREPAFRGSPEDRLESVQTPVGRVDVLILGEREDFVHALRALAYRCEPAEIPDAVGASTVRGLINWEKIRAHRQRYLDAGGTDWGAEFKRFTAEKKNYLDTLILLSSGPYSALPAQALGLTEEAWREKSLMIRKYHELTHFVSRSLYPGNIDAIRDEVIADRVGLLAAFGRYDPELARQFLGIRDGSFHDGGRLSHYAEGERLPEAVKAAAKLIERSAEEEMGAGDAPIFDRMLRILHQYCAEADA